jgi:hypothetical protein
MGRDTQLLAADGSPVSLFVLCGHRFEAAQLFRSGDLSVGMVRVDGHPVSMATCAVGDHHWMLARDALVARVDAKRAPDRGSRIALRPNGDEAHLFDPATGDRISG